MADATPRTVELSGEILESIAKILDYAHYDEQKDFNSRPEDKRENHIFPHFDRLLQFCYAIDFDPFAASAAECAPLFQKLAASFQERGFLVPDEWQPFINVTVEEVERKVTPVSVVVSKPTETNGNGWRV